MQPSPLQPKRGFTLVELLVVIAILAVLAGLLLPVTSRIRDGAKSSTCINNLRQIGVGALAYAAENNMDLPNSSGADGLTLWTEQVAPYVLGSSFVANENTGNAQIFERRKKAMKIFSCPANKILRIRSEGNGGSFGPTSYAYCNRAGLIVSENNDYNTVKLLNVSKPAQAVLIADAGTHYVPAAEFYDFTNMGKVHGGKTSLLYVDGHVSQAVPSKLDSDSTTANNGDPYYWSWGRGNGR